MAIDERLVGALHVESLRHDMLRAERDPHTIFQASTIDALLHGRYDGDVTFTELAQHGDFGLGTLNACDGEMIALDGRFYQAAVDGSVSEVAADRRTPFAVVIDFEPDTSFDVASMGQDQLLRTIDDHLESRYPCFAVRVDGRFTRVHARSVPRQSKPYRPLADVVAGQQIFDLADVDGTLVGFRFPDYAEGINVAGYHLHFIDEARRRGGHVLDLELAHGTASIDHSSDLHMELPAGVELPAGDEPDRDAIRRVEHDGSGH